jgi:hypothetical protein
LAIETSARSRALLVERLAASDGASQAAHVHVDLLNAAAAVGRLMGQSGASTTVCALTVDHLATATGADREAPPWLAAVRASLAEAFSAASLERVRADAAARWGFPRCAVPLDKRTVAIACGHPEDEADALVMWADKTAASVARAGYRAAYVSGGERAEGLLRDALDKVGVTTLDANSTERGRDDAASSDRDGRPLFRLPGWLRTRAR